jgi:hypothetical protein
MSSLFSVDRRVVAGVPGGFVAFGAGADVDDAFDAAVTGERFDVGSAGLVPSIVDVDPSAPRELGEVPGHPLAVLGSLLGRLEETPSGHLLAAPVTTTSAWRTTRTRLVLETTNLSWPDTAGPVLPLGRDNEAEIRTQLTGDLPLLWAELVSPPRRRFKVVTEAVKGPLSRRFGVYAHETLLEVCDTAALARRAAVTRAKEHPSAIALQVRPYISRNVDDPHVRVSKVLVAQRATLRVMTGELKNPEKARIAGWVFAGRR